MRQSALHRRGAWLDQDGAGERSIMVGRGRRGAVAAAAVLGTVVAAGPAAAAEAIDGAALTLPWGLPFVGLLASIALGPLAYPKFWHHHYGKISGAWALLTLGLLVLGFGPEAASTAALHALLIEYLPFVILLFALYTISGGVLIRGNIHGSPLSNAIVLAVGAAMASIVGTTGASMILIRPLIRANDNRRHNAHIVVFFIFLVSNIGGSLTPLGDPPLFVGFLKGVDFFWTLRNILPETLFVAGLTLAVFVTVDAFIYRREGVLPRDPTPDTPLLTVRGGINFVLLGAVIATILATAAWQPGILLDVHGVSVELRSIVRDAVLLVLALLSLALTKPGYRAENGFSWEPIAEVAKIFAGIFIAIIPVLAMLAAREAGPFGGLIRLVTGADGEPNSAAYFWLTGGLSSFLDNVPTYLVFFELAGGNAHRLMGYVEGHEAMAATLAAISSGAVFMGANTYIGNAPNFMVYALAKDMGVRMPSFFGYMLWSGAVLVPIFLLATVLFFA
jgi:Na+/H+ antiporter NhaD/arsenite permease-like protein